MKRPDLDTLACVHTECQLFRRAGASNLVIRKVYGHDRIRLLRWAQLQVRGLGQAKQGLKTSVDPGKPQMQEMVETGLTPRHPGG